MEGQGLITPEAKADALETLNLTENDIQKALELKRQKQLAQLRNRLGKRRRKVPVSIQCETRAAGGLVSQIFDSHIHGRVH